MEAAGVPSETAATVAREPVDVVEAEESEGTGDRSSDTVSFFLVHANQYLFDIERRQS